MSVIIELMATKIRNARKVPPVRNEYTRMVRLIREHDENAIIQAVEQGILVSLALDLPRMFALDPGRVAALLGVSEKTIRRWDLKPEEILPRAVGEKSVRLLQLREQALEVFENPVDVIAWFNEPNEAFSGRTPIDHAQTEFGCRQVERLLKRIDHGVYS